MQCDICNKEAGSLLTCDRCGKHVCGECSSSIGEDTVCGECVSKRNYERSDKKKEAIPPHYKRVLSHGGVMAILAFWLLAGIAYIAIEKAPSLGGGAVSPEPPPRYIEITGYVPVCDAGGAVYALELSVSNAGSGAASLETIAVNGKNAEYEGGREIPAKETRTYTIRAQNIFGGGFSRSSAPRGATVLVVTDLGSVSKSLTTNPAACVQK